MITKIPPENIDVIRLFDEKQQEIGAIIKVKGIFPELTEGEAENELITFGESVIYSNQSVKFSSKQSCNEYLKFDEWYVVAIQNKGDKSNWNFDISNLSDIYQNSVKLNKGDNNNDTK